MATDCRYVKFKGGPLDGQELPVEPWCTALRNGEVFYRASPRNPDVWVPLPDREPGKNISEYKPGGDK